MFELLEELEPKFKKHFNKEVNMTEITRYSININSKTWLVVTNQYIYILNKKLWFITTWKRKLKNIHQIKILDSKLVIVTEQGQKTLRIPTDRESQVRKLVEKLQEIQ
ncbi:hypothetical protein [Natranaerobius thermophilus]|uniref:YokE-like PH domain-containing protein n=1 Tax=Natranaerobius thermophilus (strain ATCC BAA-1301 / DSM 18059 / JW/NM-WN-LF) TaxID=457570 RepID=B2A6J8_NATTJ|nr:hypothetical protein [Natranaerobius thermophilus]ACB85531.1 hypothetical protein Nther_1961 [Natranaerobius thermophilus JW/NM-WN-LF]